MSDWTEDGLQQLLSFVRHYGSIATYPTRGTCQDDRNYATQLHLHHGCETLARRGLLLRYDSSSDYAMWEAPRTLETSP